LSCDEQDGDTALMMVARYGYQECVSILVANSADVNIISEVNVRNFIERRSCKVVILYDE
jgi:hypothetical protein